MQFFLVDYKFEPVLVLFLRPCINVMFFILLIGNIFEAETIVEGETIQSSRYVSCVLSVPISGFNIASF
jgi:hypothetical protein